MARGFPALVVDATSGFVPPLFCGGSPTIRTCQPLARFWYRIDPKDRASDPVDARFDWDREQTPLRYGDEWVGKCAWDEPSRKINLASRSEFDSWRCFFRWPSDRL